MKPTSVKLFCIMLSTNFLEKFFLSTTRLPFMYLYFLILRMRLLSDLNASANSALPPLAGIPPPPTGIAPLTPKVATDAVLTTETATTVRRSSTLIFEFNGTYVSNCPSKILSSSSNERLTVLLATWTVSTIASPCASVISLLSIALNI